MASWDNLVKQNKFTHFAGRPSHQHNSKQSDESYSLLLELCCQEPTMQSCFKIIESTCLSRGIDLEIRGKGPSDVFRQFVTRFSPPCANELQYTFEDKVCHLL
jgi:hypothetical protein